MANEKPDKQDKTEKPEKIQFTIDDGMEFFTDEIGVMHNPIRFFIDFKRTTPRSDQRNAEFQPLITRHQVIVMDPFLAKNFLDVLGRNIKDYEKKFGAVQKPKALVKAIAKNKRAEKKKESEPQEREMPNYLG
ncbi:DUF3467 domain-containing protein [Candidatus Woesearchaeota archaeon]|nr:DUF3467 domain-containing protein [Candidatus Woesearchaeota archaeon]